ncbi:hypothetical protein C6499_19145 [Candidatus Poribacteria bacterium]|nr:MAG: hypothetical protein C6499_19145 [Candidatus Poribacteria bacterium]
MSGFTKGKLYSGAIVITKCEKGHIEAKNLIMPPATGASIIKNLTARYEGDGRKCHCGAPLKPETIRMRDKGVARLAKGTHP